MQIRFLLKVATLQGRTIYYTYQTQLCQSDWQIPNSTLEPPSLITPYSSYPSLRNRKLLVLSRHETRGIKEAMTALLEDFAPLCPSLPLQKNLG